MRIRNQICDNGNLCIERGQAHSGDTGPWRQGEELKTEGEKRHRFEACVCVWRRSRKLLTGRYAEREISMITQTERGAEEESEEDLHRSKSLAPHIHIIIYGERRMITFTLF